MFEQRIHLNRAVSINPGGKAVRRDLTRAGVYLEALLGNGALKDVQVEEDLNHGIKVLALHHGDYIFFKKKCSAERKPRDTRLSKFLFYLHLYGQLSCDIFGTYCGLSQEVAMPLRSNVMQVNSSGGMLRVLRSLEAVL